MLHSSIATLGQRGVKVEHVQLGVLRLTRLWLYSRIIPRRSGHNTSMAAANPDDSPLLIWRKPTQGEHEAMHLPRVLSPQMHRRIDLVALPSVIASVVWMSRRDSRVAALMSMIAAGESAALLTTDYPPGFLRWMSFRDHIWAATLHGILAASLALLVPGIPRRDRRVLLALGAMPIVLSALSDTREQ